MAFVPKEWKDRLVEFAGRRKLTNVSTGEEMIVDVVRNEGAVSQEGDAFSAANMSDLEQRVADEFNNINTNLIDIYVGEDGKLHKVQGGADSVLPFSSGLLILSCRLKNSKGCKYSPTYFSNVSISYASSKQVVTLSVLKDIKGILVMNVHGLSAYQMKFSSSCGESSITKNSLSMSDTYTNAPDYDFKFKQGDTITFTLDNTGSFFILDIYVCSIAEDLVQTTG